MSAVFSHRDTEDALGLRVLEDEFAAPTLSQVLARRATNGEVVALVCGRLRAAGDRESLRRIDGMSLDELKVLVRLERKALAS